MVVAVDNEDAKKKVIIEAPSREQIVAAKKLSRDLRFPKNEPVSAEGKRQARFYMEGVLLMLMAAGAIWLLRDLGQMGWVIGAVLFAGGLLVILRSHMS
jgi:hypothetical protein